MPILQLALLLFTLLSFRESFYKTSLAEQIQSEPTKTNDEKRQMLEVLKRFEEESLEESEDASDDDITARMQGVDLDKADYDTLWELLSEEQKQRFTKAIMNPASESFKQLLDDRDLFGGREEPWWSLEEIPQTAPPVKDVPETMMAGKFNHSLLFNILHLSLTYAYTVRTFAVSALTPTQETHTTDELEEMRDFFLPLSSFLREKRSTTVFTSVDGVVTEWASHLPELPTSELLGLLTEDAKRLFRAKPVVLAEGEHGSNTSHHDYCVRFLSDLHALFSRFKKYTYVTHKLLFYLAFVTGLSIDASKELVLAIETWQSKNRDVPESRQEERGASSKVLVEEL